MKTVLNLDVLKTMSTEELEDYRNAGEDFRRTEPCSHARFNGTGWLGSKCEYRAEFGVLSCPAPV